MCELNREASGALGPGEAAICTATMAKSELGQKSRGPAPCADRSIGRGADRLAETIASSHRRLHPLRADHHRSGFRTVLLHNNEDLAPNCELVGRCLVKGDNRCARWDGDRLFSAFVVKHEHAVRSDLLDLRDIGVGHHVRLGFKIPWIVPLGQTAQRFIKHMNLARDALAVLLERRDADELARLDGAYVGLRHQEKASVVGEFDRYSFALGGLNADRSVLRGGQRAADMRLREGWRGKQHTNKNRCGCNRYPKSSRHDHLISLPLALGRQGMPTPTIRMRTIVAT